MRYEFGGLTLEGLIDGEAYFLNFTVCPLFLTKTSLKNKCLLIFLFGKEGLNFATLRLIHNTQFEPF